MKNKLTHVNTAGKVSMVDISGKALSSRKAVATARVQMSGECLTLIQQNTLQKGDVLAAAQIAAIQAAKKTAELIPLCHQVQLTHIEITFDFPTDKSAIVITASAKTQYGTGVEMEALTAASVAALTIYDMAKAVDKSMKITDIYLVKKTGGKSGSYSSPLTPRAADHE